MTFLGHLPIMQDPNPAALLSTRLDHPITSEGVAMTFLLAVGRDLGLRRQTIAVVQVYWHRLNATRKSEKQPATSSFLSPDRSTRPCIEDAHMLICACIHLACKQCEDPRKTRDIVNVAHANLNPAAPPLRTTDKEETYRRIRESIIAAELDVVRALAFELDVCPPQGWVIWMLEQMCGLSVDAPSGPPSQASRLLQLSLFHANDTLRDDVLTLQYPSRAVAFACIYLATRALGISPPWPFPQWASLWAQEEPRTILAILEHILGTYELLCPLPQSTPPPV